MRNTRSIGQNGEDTAARYLQSKGYTIITRNFRSNFGEIDIIAEHGSYLVFIEVKYRSSQAYGSPYEAVNAHKLYKLKRMVDYYYSLNKTELSPKIEVISIAKEDDLIRHITGILF
ncbi:MAG: YraN family protein [Candidatus Roizmanbacteria bacterium]|nr:YraN family protein [Candidatus Roizmanbacteria bacterium]